MRFTDIHNRSRLFKKKSAEIFLYNKYSQKDNLTFIDPLCQFDMAR